MQLGLFDTKPQTNDTWYTCPYCKKQILFGTYAVPLNKMFCDPDCVYQYIKETGKWY